MTSESKEVIPMKSENSNDGFGSSNSKGLSTKMILTITVIISVGLAIGLGVGLGVGLQNQTTQIVYMTSTTDKAATTKPGEPNTTEKPTTTTEKSTTTTEKSTTENPTTPTSTSIPEDGPWMDYRLRKTMTPSHYLITLIPEIEEDSYLGDVDITFSTTEKTKYVIVHAHSSLDISSPQLKNSKAEEVVISRTFRYEPNDFYVVETESDLVEDEDYVLHMNYYNSLTDSLVGLYKSTYVDPKTGETKGIMASDFEPTDARKGYPCFDEPSMKAEYTTEIIHAYKYTALANMPVESTEDLLNGNNLTRFQRSVPMSTYLSCFVVGELSYVEAFSGRNIPLRIYAAPYLIEDGQAELALNATVAMFDQYEELFNMTYALPKYDQIALPEFLSGAMENWGMVTFRETNLMWHPQESTTYAKQRVTAVVAHEMVHQWFGNTVTMEWWNNIWLNEGFASYFEYRGVSAANPDWLMQGHHLVDDIHSAMRADQSTGSHPINVEVNTPAEISSIFDTISYQKGSSVLNMMEYMLGTDLFIGGLRNYLKKRKFSVATEQDLWADIQEHLDSQGSPINVKTVMDPWVQQMGYPVVIVTKVGAEEVRAVQEPAFTDPNVNVSALPESQYGYEWNINLNYFTERDPDTVVRWWLNIRSDVTFTVPTYGNWLKFNDREQIFHRVKYEPGMWSGIITQLSNNPTAFSEMDRSHLVDDAFNLAPAQRIEYTDALDLTEYLDKEESYFVWDAFASGSSYIRAMLLSTDDYENFKAYYVTRVKPIADKLGWDATFGTHEQKRLRPTVLDLAARYGDGDALSNATSLYQDWKNDKYIQPDVRSVVYRYGIQAGTQDDWRYMLEKYKDSTDDGERDSLLRGLASTEDVVLIAELLELTKDNTVIKEQDFFTCLKYIAAYTLTGNTMTWSWVQVNWDYMVDRFGLDNRTFGTLIPAIVDDYNTELQKWEVETFFEARPEAGAGESGRASALLQIDLNIAWMADNAGPIGQWLTAAVAGL